MNLYIREEASGDYRVASTREVTAAARACVGRLFRRGRSIKKPADAAELFVGKLASLDAERFAVLFMDHQHRVIQYEELFFGTIDAASIHPREVIKRALHHNAATVLFAHNHPSGDTTPSRADEWITTRLKEALGLVDVRVLDHFIVGEGYTSLVERGLL
jgi:DNA repair protein RadC